MATRNRCLVHAAVLILGALLAGCSPERNVSVDELPIPPAPPETRDAYDEHIKAGSKAHLLGNIETAVDDFTAAIEANPDGSDAYLNRGVSHQELGDWSEAMADYEKAAKLNPEDPVTWNNIGMLLAACPDDSIRDGDKAVQIAQKACELTDWKHPGVLNTLAVAYAEIGDWEAAVDMQEQAIQILGDAGPVVEDFRFALELFEQQKPYRLAKTGREQRP